MNNREKVLNIFEKYPEIKPSELLELSGIAERTLRNIVNKLIKEDIIEAHGNTTERYYSYCNSYPKEKEIIILLEGDKVGTLYYGTGQHRFIYDSKYRKKELPGLQFNSENISSDLYPEFQNLIPESDRKDFILGRYNEEADILPELYNSHGAYDFISSIDYITYENSYAKRPTYALVKKEILGENIFPNFINKHLNISNEILDSEEVKAYSSLSGYQVKIDVDINSDSIFYQEQGAKYLLKPINRKWGEYQNKRKSYEDNPGYYPYVALNEHLFLSFAKNELRFDVPYSGIIYDEERKDFHYIVKRYDRKDNWKYHQRDFAQILNVKSEHKYNKTSEELFQGIKEILKDKESRLKALEFYYYGFLLQHSDLHLKNISVINPGNGRYQLSPLYDIISNGIYLGDCSDIALKIQKSKKRDNRKLGIRDFYHLADILDIKKEDFKKRAKFITLKFFKEFPKYIDKIKIIEKSIPLYFSISKIRKIPFSKRVSNFFENRAIELERNGTFNVLGVSKDDFISKTSLKSFPIEKVFKNYDATYNEINLRVSHSISKNGIKDKEIVNKD